ncbi:thioesterase domain-containing protein [Shewanella aestuarii]|uniref:Thioesterase n=1 Tax=Shewanella aestuarii TaxID=1028752 RepID=A0A6G9QFW6_9GAMM|nr:thioesterase domain-containing protein [Shewanella aestuarii]QIR13288.1 thioesterase [Shewanella aestuarii]
MVAELALIEQLETTWHQTIPLSEFMQVKVHRFMPPSADKTTPSVLVTTAPLAPNINLHNTMFAGSIYTLMTLTGWGMVWLQQKLAGQQGDIVLADAQVKYLAPVTHQPTAKVIWPSNDKTTTDLTALARGKRVKVALTVELYSQDTLCATFTGIYVSLPVKR